MSDPWTEAETETLRRVYPPGGMRAAIAALPQRTPTAIRSRCYYLKLHTYVSKPRPPNLEWANGKLQELGILAGRGLSAKAIASAMGVTKNSIIGALYRHNVDWPRRGIRYNGNITETVSLYDRLPDSPMTGCRMMFGEPREFRYCGKPIKHRSGSGHGESYCAEHRAIVWRPVE